MPNIDIETRISSPQASVAPRLETVLRGYAQQDNVTLALGLPLGGAEVAVPVTIETHAAEVRNAFEVPLTLRATQHALMFPTFDGEVRSLAGGPLESTLRLTGTYTAPLGAIGSLGDGTVLGHAAERTLRSFLERVRADTIEEIQRSELDVRMRLRA
jgi:hypothetical protein